MPLTIATEFTLALAHESDDTYELYDVYNPSYRHGGKLNVTYMGYWNNEDGLKNFLQQFKYNRRQNMYGMILNVSTIVISLVYILFSDSESWQFILADAQAKTRFAYCPEYSYKSTRRPNTSFTLHFV